MLLYILSIHRLTPLVQPWSWAQGDHRPEGVCSYLDMHLAIRITGVPGSMADMPRDLKEQIGKLEELFVVPTLKLKQISDHFVKELEKGLTKEGGSIVSCISRISPN